MPHATDLNATIDEVLRGDKDSFRKIIRDFSLFLRSFIAAHVHQMDVVDDLAQDVFIAAFRNLHEFRRDEDFGAWLRGIARNKVYEYFRNSSRRHKAMERFHEEVSRLIESKFEEVVSNDRSESIEVLLQCIGRLPDRMRRVVRSGLDGHKPVELAGELGTTVGAVYRLQYRANHLLRTCMQKALE
ncbi:sigma-70 family RNA polymerase sigma factor [Paludisphaera borealis]|uniref:RNA polymerase sigma factor n=1 Tax=Paludisphaera borealis TaxID=1387353 RepID=A0A1U7CV03_9BACT|nr:sigma-70 family RNA polymerase sigma factor [Paludisphaera borealis]APW62762.1 ECF RNA polymerase sigma-E factor [Paludisphaera borealis]MDR3620628.1 sigma-70 family RNA polymerase sigma factor [Paludisphaera borealis]